MPYLLVRFTVKDFANWKTVFDSKRDFRQTNGAKSEQIFQDAGDEKSITLLIEWDSLENARKFTQSPELKAAMQQAGVTGLPSIYFLNKA